MHQAVMVRESLEGLKLAPGGLVVDATVGAGGHARDIIKGILPGGRLIGIDRDPAAIRLSGEALADFGGSVTLINDNFRNMGSILAGAGIRQVSGVLFDLGVSSFQLEDPSRGFGFKHDSPLDMRMAASGGITAYEVVNNFKERVLADIIFKFGEERFSRRIAANIARERERAPVATTGQLASIVMRSFPRHRLRGRLHPATRTFQAIRVYVNDELGALEEGLKSAIAHLEPGGRVVVISFHSLEDRIVKNMFRQSGKEGNLLVITKKPLVPSRAEEAANPRARSAKLRVAEGGPVS